MRTTTSLPHKIFEQAQNAAPGRSFSKFALEAVTEKLARLRQESLERKMAAGDRAESETNSLASEWSLTETKGW